MRRYLNEEHQAQMERDYEDVFKDVFKQIWKYVGLDISWMKLKQNLKTRIPEFYIEVLEAWGEFKINVCIKPERREDILKSTIVLK